MQKKGATTIFILTDLDKDKCITETKNRISATGNHIVTVSIKEIEAWFLSDSKVIRKYIGDSNYTCDSPESVDEPFEKIRSARLSKSGRGVSTKTILANAMVRNGFSILNAAKQPQCDSAKYFLKKIKELSQTA